jgi:hypothetical protein
MRLVSDQSKENIRKQRARDALVFRLREFAANLLRTIRGAGQPRYLFEQMEKCNAVMREYADAHGHMPSEQFVREILDRDKAQSSFHQSNAKQENLERWAADGSLDLEVAERAIRRASLQIAASMLLGQTTFQTTAEHDLHKGVEMRETALEKSRLHRGPPPVRPRPPTEPALRPKRRPKLKE